MVRADALRSETRRVHVDGRKLADVIGELSDLLDDIPERHRDTAEVVVTADSLRVTWDEPDTDW